MRTIHPILGDTKSLSVLSALFLLAGCIDAPVAESDFCHKQQRLIPDQERVKSALVWVVNDTHSMLPELGGFIRDYKVIAPTAQAEEIASAYLEANPDCCAVVEPWPISSFYEKPFNFTRQDLLLDFYERNKAQWSKDVIVEKASRLTKKPYRVQSSPCGQIDKITE